MPRLKFLTLFRALEREEAADFYKYLKRTRSTETVALNVFGFIRKQKDDSKLEIQYVCRKLYNDDSAKAQKKLFNTFYDLHCWLKEFLLLQKANDGGFGSQFLWLAVLEERGMEEEFSKQAGIVQKKIASQPGKGIADYIQNIMVNNLVHYHRRSEKQLPGTDMLRRFKNDLDIFYAVSQLKVACELANFKNQHPEDAAGESFPVLLEFANTSAPMQHPLYLLYREIYQMMTSGQDEHYARIINLLSEHVREIEAAEMHTMLQYLHNHAASQIRAGKEAFWESTHLLDRFGVEQGVFAQENKISTIHFNNIIAAACKAKNFAWALAFVASHGIYLQAEIRADTMLLAKTIISFEQKEYKKVIETLKPRDFDAPLDRIRARAMVLLSMYELDDDDTLDYCQVFENFLRRNRDTKGMAAKATLNTIQVAKMLIRKRAPRETIREKIDTANPIYFKPWLLEKTKAYAAAK